MSEGQYSSDTQRRRFHSYPKYKDSGVEWLGKIPIGWTVIPLKRSFDVKLGKMLQNEPQSSEDSLEPYLRAANISWNGAIINDVRHMWISARERNTFALKPGDLLVSEGGDVGRSTIWHGEIQPCYYQNAINRVRERRSDIIDYLYYWIYALKNAGYIDMLCSRATISHFTAEKVASFPVMLPSKEEQNAIISFLNRETAKIDALIEKNERLIELLQEKRTALITQAVTKGLDPNVPMKDSGVEWIVQFPSNWIGLPLKRCVSVKITDGPHETPVLEDEGIDFISAEAVANGKIDFDRRRGFISPTLHAQYCRKCKPIRDDILFCKSGATTGKLAKVVADHDFSIWSPLALIRANKSRILPQFLALALESNYIQEQIKRTWSAGTQPNISMGDIEVLFVMAPPIQEQHEILQKLDHETHSFDALIEKIRIAIDRLKEYRTALISVVVTGKIDIRDVVSYRLSDAV